MPARAVARGTPTAGRAAGLLLFAALAAPVAANGTEVLKPYEGPALAARDLPRLALGPGPAALPVPGEGVSVVHFFATWCEPCRTELPALSAMAARLSGRGVQVIMVDVGEPATRVARFFETAPAAGPVVLDADRALARAWGVDVLPASLVFAAGVPRLGAVGEVAWEHADKDLLGLVPGR